jgi:hypothetical protein
VPDLGAKSGPPVLCIRSHAPSQFLGSADESTPLHATTAGHTSKFCVYSCPSTHTHTNKPLAYIVHASLPQPLFSTICPSLAITSFGEEHISWGTTRSHLCPHTLPFSPFTPPVPFPVSANKRFDEQKINTRRWLCRWHNNLACDQRLDQSSVVRR